MTQQSGEKGAMRSTSGNDATAAENDTLGFHQAVHEFVQLREDPKAKPQSRRASFGRLARAFGSEGRKIVGVLLSFDALPDDSSFRDALALELSFSVEARTASGGESTAWLSDHRDWPSYVRLFASGWITAQSLVSDASTLSARRAAVHFSPKASLDAHPLLRTDRAGNWDPGAHDGAKDVRPRVERVLPNFDFSLPLSTEAEARAQLLEFSTLARGVESNEVRARPLGLKALRRALQALRAMLATEVAAGEDTWDYTLRLCALASGNPEIWVRLNRERDAIVDASGVEGDSPSPQRWAAAVAVSWCNVEESARKLENAPDSHLAALPRAARDYNALSLLKFSKAILSQRAPTRTGDADFWQLLRGIRDVSPADRDWVETLVVERKRQLSKDAGIIAAQDWAVERLLEAEFRSLLIDAESQSAMTALAIAHQRIQTDARRRDEVRYKAGISVMRESLHRVEEMPETLTRLIGTVPEEIADACMRATRQIRAAIARASELDPNEARQEGRKGMESEPWLGSDLISGLAELEFDPARTVDASGALRSALRARLLEEVGSDGAVLAEVASAVPVLPPEAIGLVMEVGVSTRSAVLLATVATILSANSWARRVWEDAVFRFAPLDILPIPVEESLALEFVTTHLPRVQAGLSGGSMLADLERLGVECAIATKQVADALGDVAGKLQELRLRLSSGATHGA